MVKTIEFALMAKASSCNIFDVMMSVPGDVIMSGMPRAMSPVGGQAFSHRLAGWCWGAAHESGGLPPAGTWILYLFKRTCVNSNNHVDQTTRNVSNWNTHKMKKGSLIHTMAKGESTLNGECILKLRCFYSNFTVSSSRY